MLYRTEYRGECIPYGGRRSLAFKILSNKHVYTMEIVLMITSMEDTKFLIAATKGSIEQTFCISKLTKLGSRSSAVY